ncbi:hypothetical protein BK026_00715 [Alteromonas sp. V450]|nr:hypothetical protein BK026_00715 [Alteromonas sp. V450]
MDSSLYLISLLKLQAWLNNYRALLLGLYSLFISQALIIQCYSRNLEYSAFGIKRNETAAAKTQALATETKKI